jgi:AcrR family transcriptional regulator
MDARIKFLRGLEPKSVGQASYLAILEAAAGLFQQFPPEAITLRDILGLSGVSNQTLYNYFPAGRDDVVIALFDRFQQGIVLAFRAHVQALAWESHPDPHQVTRALAAALARATFGPLKDNLRLQSAVYGYLRAHRLGSPVPHTLELEETLHDQILLRYGGQFSKPKVPQTVKVGVRIVHTLAEMAATHPELSLDHLESSTRKLLRALLEAGLHGTHAASGDHAFLPDDAISTTIVGAPISPAKRETILARILKRRPRD